MCRVAFPFFVLHVGNTLAADRCVSPETCRIAMRHGQTPTIDLFDTIRSTIPAGTTGTTVEYLYYYYYNIGY
jgi:hypothetical protein